jgi:LDH2 family malate/lactate/ureidoglycolate dehydrogenase
VSETPDYPHDLNQETVVPVAGLKEFLTKLLVKKGMFAAEAQIVVARLLEADLRGIQSHGCRMVPQYLRAMDAGQIDPRGQILTVTSTPAMAVLDGGRAMGHLAATKAMQLAIDLARSVGTGTVAVKNSQHFGAASVYALMAVQAGMIGYCTTSTAHATVAPYGSRSAGTANNAFAWGAPVRSGPPFVLDMAVAVSSWGKIFAQKFYGGEIPPGWAYDAEGQPTTDPAAAKVLLPAAGARGYGLAVLSSILAGTLVGAKMPIHKTRGVEVEGSEHFFYAIDLSKFTDPEAYYAEMDQSFADLRALPPAPGFDRVRLPGELEAERSAKWSVEGIPLHRGPLEQLVELATKYKLTVPWTN